MTDPDATSLSLLSSAIAGAVAQATPAIVSVHSHRSRASGFVWRPNLVVTPDEALADEGEISIKLSDGSIRPARIAGRDHTTDVALLRLDTRDDAKAIAPIRLSPDVPMLGSLSVVVAAERGLPTAALGAVSLVGGRWRSLRGGEIDARVELDVRLRHGTATRVVLC
jgi:S1-C subfamily serine protease